jgi:hypothetical protein
LWRAGEAGCRRTLAAGRRLSSYLCVDLLTNWAREMVALVQLPARLHIMWLPVPGAFARLAPDNFLPRWRWQRSRRGDRTQAFEQEFDNSVYSDESDHPFRGKATSWLSESMLSPPRVSGGRLAPRNPEILPRSRSFVGAAQRPSAMVAATSPQKTHAARSETAGDGRGHEPSASTLGPRAPSLMSLGGGSPRGHG